MRGLFYKEFDVDKNAESQYFFECIKKCRILRGVDKLSLQEYLQEGWRDLCYVYSAYNIMGLKSTDRLMRGVIYTKNYRGIDDWSLFEKYNKNCHYDRDLIGYLDFPNRKINKYPNYAHGWVEFDFDNKTYIYDNQYSYPVLKQEWEQEHSPYVLRKVYTQKELLEMIENKYKDKLQISTQDNQKIIVAHEIHDKFKDDYIGAIFFNSKFVLENDEVVDFEVEPLVSG